MGALLQTQPGPRPPRWWGPATTAAHDNIRTYELPLGYWDPAGRKCREVELRPLTGHEQRLLASFDPKAPASVVTTALLARCLVRLGNTLRVSPGLVRDLLVGDREFLLLKLFEITFGNTLFVELRCPAEGCGESLEFLVSLEQCIIEAPPVQFRTFVFKPRAKGKRGFRFRLPTGRDQEALAAANNMAEDEIMNRVFSMCCARSTRALVEDLTPEDRARLDEEMHRLAPTLEVEVEATCVQCRTDFSARVDIPFLVLNEMKIPESELDREIHCLALHYKWAESEILSLTPKRRRGYLDLLQGEFERAGES